MEVESHEEALVEVMVFCKLRPAAFEVLLTGTIIPNLHFIWSSSTRLFTENLFPQFSPIHELGKIQRQVLNLMALHVGDAKERKYSRQSRRSTRGGALGPGVVLVIFGLFLLPAGRPGHRFTGTADEDPTASGAVLFLLPWGQP
jgi:hypothetical protein